MQRERAVSDLTSQLFVPMPGASAPPELPWEETMIDSYVPGQFILADRDFLADCRRLSSSGNIR